MADRHTSESAATADDFGESEAEKKPQEWMRVLGALERATELFVGFSDPVDDSIRTFVTELPQWFQHSKKMEAKIRVGDKTFETDGFHRTTDCLTAETRTHTGTPVSMTVGCTGQRAWLASERELVEKLASLIKDRVDQWEIDSLKRMSDGIVALDSDLHYTYVNPQAEQILERDSDELCGEYIWDAYPAATNTGFQSKVERALETQSPTSIDGYYTQAEKWIEARIYPNNDGVIIAFTDVTDSKVIERENERILEMAPIGIVLLDGEGEITRANTRAEELLGLSRDSIDGMGYDHSDWDIWDESGDPIPREDHPVTHVLATGETVEGFTHGITLPDGTERWLSSNVAPIKSGDGEITQIAVALEDITRFKRVKQLMEAFQLVNEALNCATQRRKTQHDICELLTDTREYQYARISEYMPGTESYIEKQPETVSCHGGVDLPVQSQTEIDPARIVIETGNVQVVASGQTDSRFATWRKYTLDQGFKGGAIVPLGHGDRVYGLLVLYTDRPEAFGDREQMLLATLGDRIGQVFHTLETERLIHADEVVELTFQSTDPESFFISTSEQLGCTIDIRDTIQASKGTLVHYASVEGTSLAAFGEVVENTDHVVQMRQIRHTEDPPGGDVEIELHRQSLAQTLITMGAVVNTNTVTDGRAEVVCEIPLGHDTDSLVTRLTDSFPETTLVAKRNYDRSPKPDPQLVGQVEGGVFDEELTDRQQQVLRAAVYGGYFQSPRRSTATEIADALSLTQSTFSYHLRNAQQILFQHLADRLQR